MGNHSTSGIVGEAPEKAQEVSSRDNLRQENQTLIQEDDIKDFQEQTAGTAENSDNAEAQKEEHEGSVNEECETQAAVLPHVMSSHVKKGSDLEEGFSMFSNGEMLKRSDSSSNRNATTTSNSNSLRPHEAVDMTSEPQEDHSSLVKEIVDDHEVEKNEDDFIVDDMASIEGIFLETHTQKYEVDVLSATDSIENVIINERKNGKQDEFLALTEDKVLTINELSDGDKTNYVDQSETSDQESNQFLICSTDAQLETIICEKNEGEESHCDLIDKVKAEELKDPMEANEMVKDVGLVQTNDLIAMVKNQEDDKLKTESSALENDRESEMEPAQKDQSLCNIETPMLEDNESKGDENRTEMLDNESNPSHKGVQVELKKSPSFDFGLPFDAATTEESDQTPLLYQDRAAIRSFSSSSTLRFHNRSVQTEYSEKSSQYEAVEMEEKTIRMERSNSESLRSSKEVTKAKQENSASDDQKQESCQKASGSNEDRAITSPKGNGNRKSRSSLFTTCICCTTAIS